MGKISRELANNGNAFKIFIKTRFIHASLQNTPLTENHEDGADDNLIIKFQCLCLHFINV